MIIIWKSVFTKIKVIFETCLGFIISLLLVFFISPLLIFFWFYSSIVHILIYSKLGKTYIRPAGLDIMQGIECPESKPYLSAIGRFKGTVDIEKFRNKFVNQILNMRNEAGHVRFRKFKQVFQKVFGYHVFVDAQNFDIKNHIRSVRIEDLFPEKYSYRSEVFSEKCDQITCNQNPYSFDSTNNSNVIEQNSYSEQSKKSNLGLFFSSFGSKKILSDIENPKNNLPKLNNSHNREILTDESKTAHSDIPEIAWEDVISRVMGEHGVKPLPPGVPQWEIIFVQENGYCTGIAKIHHSISDGIYFLRFYLEYLGDESTKCELPYNYHQPNLLARIRDLTWAFCLMPKGFYRMAFAYKKNPLHGPKLSGKKMFLLSKAKEVEKMKEIKRYSKTSMNAVLFSCLSNAIAKHFIAKKCAVDDVVVLVPVSLQDLRRPIKLKNQFGIQGLLLPTFLDQNSPKKQFPSKSLDRLKEIQKSCNRTKNDASFLAIHCLMVFVTSLLLSSLLTKLFRTSGLTTSLSNVVGPKNEKFQLMGCPKVDFCFFIPDRSPLGMGVSVGGFANHVRIGLMIDTALMESESEGHKFLEDFQNEIDTLFEEISIKKMKNEKEETKINMS